eukprot:3844956-Alexandrium_andersonii.AAC.1
MRRQSSARLTRTAARPCQPTGLGEWGCERSAWSRSRKRCRPRTGFQHGEMRRHAWRARTQRTTPALTIVHEWG